MYGSGCSLGPPDQEVLRPQHRPGSNLPGPASRGRSSCPWGTRLRTRCRYTFSSREVVRAWFSLRTAHSPSWCAPGARDERLVHAYGPSRSGHASSRRSRHRPPCGPWRSSRGTSAGSPPPQPRHDRASRTWPTCGRCPHAASRSSCAASPPAPAPCGSPRTRAAPSDADAGPSSAGTSPAAARPARRSRDR